MAVAWIAFNASLNSHLTCWIFVLDLTSIFFFKSGSFSFEIVAMQKKPECFKLSIPGQIYINTVLSKSKVLRLGWGEANIALLRHGWNYAAYADVVSNASCRHGGRTLILIYIFYNSDRCFKLVLSKVLPNAPVVEAYWVDWLPVLSDRKVLQIAASATKHCRFWSPEVDWGSLGKVRGNHPTLCCFSCVYA